MPGVAEVLEKLAADGVPYCVASSGSHRADPGRAAEDRADERFGEERIFSSQDVGRGKPAPDLFLHAAELMGVAPERCAVVEDSPLGVQAARAAGMDVYGFTAMTPAERLGGRRPALFGRDGGAAGAAAADRTVARRRLPIGTQRSTHPWLGAYARRP